MEWEQQNEILNRERKKLDDSTLTSKKQLIINNVRRINSSLEFSEWLNTQIPLYVAPIHLFSKGRLCVYPTESGEIIYVDDDFYNNQENKDVITHQFTHELLHSLRQVKKYADDKITTKLFCHAWYEYDKVLTGIDEAITQMFTDDFEEFRLDKAQDKNFYFIKNIMRFMKVMIGEEKLLMQYLNYNQEFEKEFDRISDNKFVEFATLINDIYNLEYKNKTNEEILLLESKKQQIVSIVKTMIDKTKEKNPDIVKLISDDLQNDDFLDEYGFSKKNTATDNRNEQTDNNSKIISDLKIRLAEYVKAIIEKYGKYIPQERLKELINLDYNDDNLIRIYDYGTVNGFADNTGISLPLCADRLLKIASKIPGFGINKKHKTYTEENIIINDNTFAKYIFHVFVSGTDAKGYYEDLLLHEAMHFCGSGGSTALREGINEFLTRKLAKEKGLRTNGCGYPKEVNVVFHLQNLFGEEVLNQIAFLNSEGEIAMYLTTHIGLDAATLYLNISKEMDKEFNEKYSSKFDSYNGLSGILKKTINYHKINYSKIYEMIKEYELQRVKSNQSNIESEINKTR